MNKTIWIVIAAILIFGGIWYFSKGDGPVGPGDEVVPPVQTETPAGDNNTSGTGVEAGVGVSVGTTKEFTLTGSDFSFTPTTMTVNKGDRVKVIFKNADGTHDFKLDEFGVATKKLGTGESDTVTFVADKAGTFEYYCSVGQHRAMGMKGTLVVK